jgi:ABC-type glycerol-3-phosphate transport system permease component
MKKILIFFIAIIVLVVVVLPLIYIALGKLKSPVDTISEDITKQTFAYQNYIPDQAEAVDPDHKNPNTFDDEVEMICEKTEVNLKSSDITQYQVVGTSSKYIATSTDFAFNWNLPGVWEKLSDKKVLNSGGFPLYITGGAAASNKLTLGMYAKKNSDQKCADYFKRMFNQMHDSNRFLSKYDWDKAGFILREKGLINIRGISYYWYGFDDTSKEDADLGNGYLVIFNAYKNGVEYGTSFMGYKKVNGSYRAIKDASIQYIGRLIIK